MEKEAEILLPQERRDYPRISINIKVRYRVITDEPGDKNLIKHFDADKILSKYNENTTINMSSSGLLMYTNEEIPVKSFIAVNMYIPLPGLSCSCKVLGEVVRSEKENEKFKLAVKFLKVLWHNLNKYRFLTLTDLLDIKGEEIKID